MTSPLLLRCCAANSHAADCLRMAMTMTMTLTLSLSDIVIVTGTFMRDDISQMTNPIAGSSTGAYPRATDGGNTNESVHHWNASVPVWRAHCEAGIGDMPPIPYHQKICCFLFVSLCEATPIGLSRADSLADLYACRVTCICHSRRPSADRSGRSGCCSSRSRRYGADHNNAFLRARKGRVQAHCSA